MNKTQDIPSIVQAKLCHCCGACSVACPTGAITYQETVGGYLFPRIDTNHCISCGMCWTVCPIIHISPTMENSMPDDIITGNIIEAHVGRAVNNEIFRNSQSGGVVTALLDYLMATHQVQASIVVIMEKGNPPRGRAIVVKNRDELMKSQKSKYTPIPLLQALNKLEDYDTKVALVGLGCHVHGLYNLIDTLPQIRKRDFIKIGLFCDRILTSSAIDFLAKKATGKDVVNLVFRDKLLPQYPGNVRVDTADGSTVVLDKHYRLAIKNYFTPLSCRLCFDKFNTFADVVMGDPHGIDGIDRIQGETLVLTRTGRGREIISNACGEGYLKIRKVDINEALNGQKVEQKKQQWSAYMKAQTQLGGPVPPYINQNMMPKINLGKYKEELIRSKKLDSFDSREAVLNAADQWLKQARLKKNTIELPRRVFGKIKRVLGGESWADSMIIEIRKAGFVNKGAELMLLSIIQKVKEKYSNTKLTMVPSPSAPYEERTKLGLYQKVSYRRYRVQWGFIFSAIPGFLRKPYGLVLDKELNVVLDAAGFSYGDQWGARSTIELAKSLKKWKRYGTKVILLPQAFGPFASPAIKKAITIVADHADLIFPREKTSYQHLVEVVGERENISIAPDFTNILEGIVPDSFNQENNKFCIVPNYRMIDKTLKEISEAYRPFLIFCARYLLEKQAKPFFLIHEGENDYLLAHEASSALGLKIPIIKETDPIKIKGILGTCTGTIGSRYHGLVSALSQGVPSLATGWSHKYRELFDDYGFPEGMIDITSPDLEIKEKIDTILDYEKSKNIQNTIIKHSVRLKKQTEKMWNKVFAMIEKNLGSEV
jgi:coenzyme F420-reducing hydrogenase beta subunit/polysaccharide pyruvyl transferase WcaK-like protein